VWPPKSHPPTGLEYLNRFYWIRRTPFDITGRIRNKQRSFLDTTRRNPESNPVAVGPAARFNGHGTANRVATCVLALQFAKVAPAYRFQWPRNGQPRCNPGQLKTTIAADGDSFNGHGTANRVAT
jgi:hypothetical protein